jgi:hypothetical protein
MALSPVWLVDVTRVNAHLRAWVACWLCFATGLADVLPEVFAVGFLVAMKISFFETANLRFYGTPNTGLSPFFFGGG